MQVNFDGVDDHVLGPTSTLYDLLNQTFTVQFWYRATPPASQGYLVTKRTSTAGGGWFARLDSGGTLTARVVDVGNGASAERSTGSANHLDGTWRLATVVFTTDSVTQVPNGSDVLIMINGSVDQGSRSSNSETNSGSCGCPLVLGALSDQATGTFLVGSLDSVQIFTRALSQAEATWWYQQGRSSLPPVFQTAPFVAFAPSSGRQGSFLPFFK